MSGSDYTTTPNLGLYKPNYALDVGQWGNHLNLNSDVLDAAFGIGSAGAVNALNFGADPTGVADSSAAINAAAGQASSDPSYRKSVYLPSGTYHIRRQLNLTHGQTLFGDGRGNTTITVSDDFDPAASSVINITPTLKDPGPTVRDLRIFFAQPDDVVSRATFKTLLEGGTSALGGTGVKYPWCISTDAPGARISIQNVRIEQAWDGITTNGNNVCYWIDGLQIGAFDVGMSLGEGANAVLDWAHLSDVEFWNFGHNTPALQAVYMDGQTIAMRLGAQNGLTAQNISCFASRIVMTSQASGGWFSFTNLAMDTAQATIEIASSYFVQISNLYYSAGTTAPRAAISIDGGGPVMINNLYAFSQAPVPLLRVGNCDVTVVGGEVIQYNPAASAAVVTFGTLRMAAMRVYAGNANAWTKPLIEQSNGGILQLSNVDLTSVAGSSGTAVKIGVDNVGNMIGNVALSAGWSNSIVGQLNGIYPGSLRGPASIISNPPATAAQLSLGNVPGTFSVESKMRFFGSFPNSDSSSYMAAALRSGWSALAFTASYLDVWLTNAGNPAGAGDDATMVRAARFTPGRGGVAFPLLASSASYANDAAAQAGGVQIGDAYRNGSAVMIRVA